MPAHTDPSQKEVLPVNMNRETIWQAHKSIDGVYGPGFAKENPLVVARFMMAFALRDLAEAQRQMADEAAGLRQLLTEGSGAITVGLDKG
jgi:hypothetical protein